MWQGNTRRLLCRILYIILGSFIYAFAVNALFIPHQLLSGGLTGIAMILEYLFKIPTALTVIILNIPLFIGGYKFLGKRFTYLSILGIISMSIFLSLTKGWTIKVEDTMIASIFGGLISGVGSGIIIKNRGSLGGTDIISVVVNRYFSFSIGGVAAVFNIIVLGTAALLFNVEMAMFTMVGLFVSSRTIDIIQAGFNHRKTVIIVSDKSEEMAAELFQRIRRGITFVKGEGAYTRRDKKLIYMVVRTMELSKLKEVVRKVDPNAFMSIIDTTEVEGKGFSVEDLF